MSSKRRTIVPKKEVKHWTLFEGRPLSVLNFANRKQAREAAKKIKSQSNNYVYVGRCTHSYRYIILDTH